MESMTLVTVTDTQSVPDSGSSDGWDTPLVALLRHGAGLGLFDLDCEDVAGAEHVGAEDDQRVVGRKEDVGLLEIVVALHVDEVLGAEETGLPLEQSLSSLAAVMGSGWKSSTTMLPSG